SLYTSVTGPRRDAAHIEALSLDTGQRRVVVEPGIRPLYAPSGHLVFFRDDALVAAPFDVRRLEINGPAVPTIEDIAVDESGAGPAAVSKSGALVYAPRGTAPTRLVWVSRQGLEQPITDTSHMYQTPGLAPDGRHIVVQAAGDLWIQDTMRATFTRLTSDETVGNSYPV